MAFIRDFSPLSAELPSSGFAALFIDGQGRPYLAHDTTTSEGENWSFTMPPFSGALSVKIEFRAASATSGTFAPAASLEAITPGDGVNTNSTSSFDTVNNGTATTVPPTAGYVGEVTVTLTNKDSVAAGDLCRLKIARNTANDNAAGDIHILSVALYDAS